MDLSEKEEKLAKLDRDYKDESDSCASHQKKAAYHRVWTWVCLGIGLVLSIPGFVLLFFQTTTVSHSPFMIVIGAVLAFVGWGIFVNLFFVHLILWIVHGNVASHQASACESLKAERAAVEKIAVNGSGEAAGSSPVFGSEEAAILLKSYKEQHDQGQLTDEQYQAKLLEIDAKTKK
jgi:uncharacterized membrane protein